MKSIRCRLGIHKEYAHQYFPKKGPVEMVGVQCDRCNRYRVVNQSVRMVWDKNRKKATDEAAAWLEEQTGVPVTGTFVHFR